VEWLAFRLHGHHVPRDVEANVSSRAVVGEGDAPAWQPLGNIAIGVVAVANLRAAAKARDVLQGLPVVDGVAVDLLDFRARLLGKRGQMPLRHRFQQVAVGCSTQWRVGRRRGYLHQGTASHGDASTCRQVPQEPSPVHTMSHHSSCCSLLHAPGSSGDGHQGDHAPLHVHGLMAVQAPITRIGSRELDLHRAHVGLDIDAVFHKRLRERLPIDRQHLE